MSRANAKNSGKLDDAARAAWLYYVAGNTQDEVAEKMRISRQAAQRLVSLAVRERLIKVRLDHPIASCMQLAAELVARFGLDGAEIVPTDPAAAQSTIGVAEAGAGDIERWLVRPDPVTLAFGTGRTLRAVADQLVSTTASQHTVVSLVGNIAPDGSASAYDVLAAVAERVGAPHYPLPVPVIASTEEEKRTLHALSSVRHNIAIAKRADVAYVGIGQMKSTPPMLVDGFLTSQERDKLLAAGGVGEIIGWVFDSNGEVLDCDTNKRVVSVPLDALSNTTLVGVVRGRAKYPALRAALAGGLLNRLITDEEMALRLLK